MQEEEEKEGTSAATGPDSARFVSSARAAADLGRASGASRRRHGARPRAAGPGPRPHRSTRGVESRRGRPQTPVGSRRRRCRRPRVPPPPPPPPANPPRHSTALPCTPPPASLPDLAGESSSSNSAAKAAASLRLCAISLQTSTDPERLQPQSHSWSAMMSGSRCLSRETTRESS